MFPYILVFLITLLFTFFAEKSIRKNRKKICFFLLLLIVIVLSLFAGLRTVKLGYDTQTYVLNTYKWATSGLSLSKIFSVYGLEKGFIAYVYLLCRINNNFNFILFCLNLPVNAICIYYIYYHRKNRSMTLLMTIYYCTLYAFSFNIVRQSLTVALFLLIMILLEKKKYVLSILLFLLGCYIHNSMVFSLFTIIVIKFDDLKILNKKYKFFINFFTILLLIVLLIFYKNIIQISYNSGIISEKYLHYINSESSDYRETINIEYSLLFLKSAIMFLVFIYYGSKKITSVDKSKNRRWLIMLLVDYIITFLSFKLANTDRISWYLYYPAIFMFSTDLKKSFKDERIGNLIIAFIFILYLLEKLITNQYRICPYEWIL